MRAMKTTLLALAALAALATVPAPAAAQVEIRFGLPALPSLVVVQPGIQVVQDYDDEVFVQGGWYWARRGDHWYRGRGPQSRFVLVETRLVPEPLRRLPPGHYRRYRPPPPQRARFIEERHEDKKEEKRHRKEEERERREREHREHDRDHDRRGGGDR